MGAGYRRNGNGVQLLTNIKTGADLRIGRVDGQTFHDVFAIVRQYLKHGDAVDLHDSYGDDVQCWLSEDGLSGFAVEQDGNIVSVFSLGTKGFLRTVFPLIKKSGGTKLDCYQFPGKTNLPSLYESAFGFKRASSMAYDESFEPEDPARERHGFGERHGMPRIVFMVADPGHAVEEKTFDGDYDGAVAWQNANLPARPRYSISGLYTGSAADYAERVPVLDKDGNVTGYRIDNAPSLQHVGTGEGSQVYGWGLYASNQRGVAESYGKVGKDDRNIYKDGRLLGNGDFESPGEWLINMNREESDPVEAAKKAAREEIKNGDDDFYVRALKEIEGSEWRVEPKQSNLYEQTFFTDRADGEETERHLLKWYEPVSDEQRKWIRDAIRDMYFADEFKEGGAFPERRDAGNTMGDLSDLLQDGRPVGTGETLYHEIATILGSPKAASEFLARAGIDGIKYPVDSWGGKGVKNGDEAGWNYVSFRDDNIRVDHKWVDGEQRYSIVPINGRDMMVVANSLLTAKEAQDETKVRDMLRNTIVGKEFAQLGAPTDKPVKVSPKFVKEFWNSEQAKSQRKIAKLWRAKVGAAVNLEDLLATTPLGPKEAPKHTNGQFKNGAMFYRCPTKFGVFVPGMGINVYPCNLLILETKSGKRYAFDIADMEKPTLAAIGSLSGETLELLQGGGSNGGSVRPATLPQAPASVNPGAQASIGPREGADAWDPTSTAPDVMVRAIIAADSLGYVNRTDADYATIARRLGSKESVADARAAADKYIKARAQKRGTAAFADILGDMQQERIMSRATDLFSHGMGEGAELGVAGEKAMQKARRAAVAAATHVDYDDVVADTGLDIVGSILDIGPARFYPPDEAPAAAHAELAEAARQYDEVVARYTNPDGSKKPGWMKAPNGADTHLAERQWVQVRTENFKRWFGDWEARYYS